MNYKTNKKIDLQKIKPLLHIILLLLIGLYVYAGSLHNEFLWDDHTYMVTNPNIKDFSLLPRLFTTNMASTYVQDSRYYRPLQMFTYMMDYSLWKLNPQGYHITNILLHLLVSLTLYCFVSLLSGKRSLAFFTSLVFVIHPIHISAVDFIAGRASSLSSLFILLSMIFYIKCVDEKNRTKNYILLIAAYILALLSKEISLILPFLLVLYHFTFYCA